VREADVRGVWSPDRENAERVARLARDLDVGDCTVHDSISDMVADPAIGAIWICGPNHARIENVEEVVHAIESGRGSLYGLACEKPLARNLDEAIRVRDLAARVGLKTGYLEDARIWRAPPRSTAAPTRPGSGRAVCRAAASSTT
jgi:predicted dehydrogenase